MDLNRTPSQIASAAAEEVRALNHKTLDEPYESAADISGTFENLARLIDYLNQTVQQAESSLTALHEKGQIRISGSADSAGPVGEATAALENTRNALTIAREALYAANGRLSTMGAPWSDDDEGE